MADNYLIFVRFCRELRTSNLFNRFYSGDRMAQMRKILMEAENFHKDDNWTDVGALKMRNIVPPTFRPSFREMTTRSMINLLASLEARRDWQEDETRVKFIGLVLATYVLTVYYLYYVVFHQAFEMVDQGHGGVLSGSKLGEYGVTRASMRRIEFLEEITKMSLSDMINVNPTEKDVTYLDTILRRLLRDRI